MPAQFGDDAVLGLEGIDAIRLRLPDGTEHRVRVEHEPGGTYLNDLQVPLASLAPAPMDTVELKPIEAGLWAASLVKEAAKDVLVISLGRGWAAVPV